MEHNYSDEKTFEKLIPVKLDLFDWYFNNLTESVMELADRIETSWLLKEINFIGRETVLGKSVFKVTGSKNVSSKTHNHFFYLFS